MPDNRTNKEIELLKEQLRLLEEMDKLQQNFVSSRAKSSDIEAYISKQTKLQSDLEAVGLKNMSNRYNVEEALEKIRKKLGSEIQDEVKAQQTIYETEQKRVQVNEDISNSVKERQKTEKEEVAEFEKLVDSELKRLSTNNKLQNLQEDYIERQKDIITLNMEATREEKKRALESDKVLKNIEKEIRLENQKEKNKADKERIQGSIRIPGLGSVSDLQQFSGMSRNYQIFSVAVDTFNKAVGTFSDLFTGGMNRIADRANTQFHNISVRTGMSYSTYRSGIGGLGGQLSNWNGLDLQDNLKVSDVQDMMNTLASKGLGQENLLSNAVENAITNSIVPYLDVESEQFNLLNSRLNGEFVKQIRGISVATNDISGNTVMNQSVLNMMLDALAPMSDKALQDLAKDSTEVSALMDDLINRGMTQDQALAYGKQLIKQQQYGNQIMNSGTPYERVSYWNQFLTGTNIYQDPLKGIANNIRTSAMFGSMAPGYGDTSSGLFTSIFGDAMGLDFNSMNAGIKAYENGLGGTGWESKYRISDDKYNYYKNVAEKLFANGDTQTAEEKQITYMENISSELAMWKVDMGKWFDVLTTAVKGIATMLVTYLAGKALGGIANLATGGSGGGVGSLVSNGLTAFAGTSLGYQAMGVGASMGINSIPAATAVGMAVPTAIAAGGIAGGAYGISKGVEDWQNDHKVRGGISAAGGAAMAAGGVGVAGGMLAAGAANAWNPVGWGLLIAGGLAVAGTAIARASDTTVDLADELEASKQAEMERIRDSNEQTISNIEDVREQIRQAVTDEEAKNIALQNGLINQNDLNDATKTTKDALLKLADAALVDQKELNLLGEETVDVYEDVKNDEKNSAGDSILDIVNTAKLGGRTYKDLSDSEKQKINQFMQAYIATNKNSSNGDVQWRIKEWGNAFDDDVFSEADFNKIFNGNNNLTSQLFEDFVSSDKGAKALSKKAQ